MDATKRLVPHVPLSGTQRSVWFAQTWAGHAALNDPVVLRLSGRLDVSALRTALSVVAGRHRVLATSLVVREGVPVLAFDGEPRFDLSVTSVPPGTTVEAVVGASLRTPESAAGPLVRVRLFSVSDEDHILVLTTHRLVSDYQSDSWLMSELSEVYAAVVTGQPPHLPEPAMQYPDHARWQQAWLASHAGQRELERLTSHLAGSPTLELPADHPRRAPGTPRAGQVRRAIGRSLPAPDSLPTVLAASLAAVLTRHTGGDEVVLGLFGSSPGAAPRGRVGPFDDPVVLRVDTCGDPTLAELVDRTTAALGRATSTVPFAAVVDRLGLRPEPDRHPVFQVGLAVRERRCVSLPGLRVEALDLPAGDLAVDAPDLSVTATRTGDGTRLDVRYRADLFDRWRIEALTDHLVDVFEVACGHPDQRLWQVDLLSPAEHHQVVAGWHGPTRPVGDAPVYALVDEQAARTPGAVAVVDAAGELTYRQLEVRSNRLANHLRSLGVGPGVLVAVFLPRDVELVVTLLAVLKAGGAYVPLDLGYPAGRIEMILHDARAGLVLTRSTLRARLPDTGSATVVPLDRHEALVAAAGDQAPPVDVDPERLCHVVFTSGSTGRPKGVATCHRNLTGYLSGLLAVVEPDRFARVLFSTAASFDACLVELWPPLLVGGTLVVVDNLLLVSDQVDHHDRVTLINTVPSVLSEYLRLGRLPRALRTLTIGAEPLPGRLVDQVFADSSVEEIYNMYGPTETTAYATMRRLTRQDRTVTIGRPLDNVRTYILDRAGRPTPVGVPGELHLGGPGVAHGYLGRPDLTAERFVPDHLGPPGGRLYRTGDLARWTPDGEIDFLGRVDTQVKLRGFRIELGEIEATLARQPEVAQAVAAIRTDPAGEPQLVGYVVPAGKPPAHAALGAFCRSTLPSYMEPAAFAVIDAVPLSPTGKVNRAALPEPDWPRRRAVATTPATVGPVESEVLAICADLLDRPDLRTEDDLFDRGARWPAVLRLCHRVRRRFGVDLTVRQVFGAPTVAELARVVAGAVDAAGGPEDLPDVTAGHPRRGDGDDG